MQGIRVPGLALRVPTAALLAISLAACGGDDDTPTTPATSPSPAATGTVDPSATPPRMDIDVVDVGVWNFNDQGTPRTQWVAIVRNGSADRVLRDAKVTLLIYAANNTLLASATETVVLVLPSQEVAVGGAVPAFTGTPARISVRPETGRSDAATSATPSWVPAPGQYVATLSTPEIRGAVANPFPSDLKNVRVTCVAFGDDGSPLAYAVQSLDLPAAGSRPVICQLSSEPSKPVARASLYATLAALP